MSRLFLIVVAVLFLFCTINAAELPMVMYTTNDTLVLPDTAELRDDLGINYIYGTVDSFAVGPLKDARFGLIKWGGEGWSNNINYYSGKSYFQVGATDDTSFPRFQRQRGTPSGGHLVSNTAEMALDSLWFFQNVTSGFNNETYPRSFFAQMRLAIDTNSVAIGDTIGTLYVHRLVDSMIVDSTYLGDSLIVDTTYAEAWDERAGHTNFGR